MDFIVCMASSARCNIINLGQVFHAFSISLTLISQPKAITIIIVKTTVPYSVHILKNKCKTIFPSCMFASVSSIFVVCFCLKIMTDRMDENNNKIDRVSNILLIFEIHMNACECNEIHETMKVQRSYWLASYILFVIVFRTSLLLLCIFNSSLYSVTTQ